MKVGVSHLVVFLALLSCGCNGDLLPVPASGITAKDLANYLSLGDTDVSFPALYVFGDSYLDAGNNHHTNSTDVANYPPYGIDFVGKATGRFTNGRLSVDFIAQLAGLPFPPAILGMTDTEKKTVKTGVNYASATAGVQPESATLMKNNGHFLTLNEQVDLFETTTKELRTQFNNAESFAEYLSKSIFFLHISSNDMGIYWGEYLAEYMNTHAGQFPDKKPYVTNVSVVYSEQLKRLYNLGARKFFINNVSPIGCMPFQRFFSEFKMNGKCFGMTNELVSMYNQILKDAIPKLQSSLSGSKFVLSDFHQVINDLETMPQNWGLKNITDGCCEGPMEHGIGRCIENKDPCPIRSNYLFFDSNHPTELVHFIWARRALKDSSISSPYNLIDLIKA